MTVEDAFRLLSEGTSHERLKAARYLAHNARPEHIALLRSARQNEAVSYVQNSLDSAIRRISQVYVDEQTTDIDDFSIPEDVRKRIRAEAVEWIAGLLLHEIASPIGLVARSASREIPDYVDSKTKEHIDSIFRTFQAIRQLKSASALPKLTEFDLSQVLYDLVKTELDETAASNVSLQGPSPLVVATDENLVRLAVSNGLRNAVEAVQQLKHVPPHPIVVSYGQTDVDYWISIIDRGAGLVGPSESAFSIGSSTKKGHSGFGLAIARQALETISGTVTLSSAGGSGTRYELRWER